jgi:hypothetical protein
LFDSALKSENNEILKGLLDYDNNDNNDIDDNNNDDDNNNNNNNNDDNNHNDNNDNNNKKKKKNRNFDIIDRNDSKNDENENNNLLPVSEGEIHLCKIRTLEDIFLENKYISIDLLKVRMCIYKCICICIGIYTHISYSYLYGCVCEYVYKCTGLL